MEKTQEVVIQLISKPENLKYTKLKICPAHRNHLALGRHEGGPVAKPQLGLQGVEVDLQLAFFLHTGRLVDAAVVTEILQLLLHGAHGLLRHTVLQPGDGAADPLQQLQKEGKCKDYSISVLYKCLVYSRLYCLQ